MAIYDELALYAAKHLRAATALVTTATALSRYLILLAGHIQKFSTVLSKVSHIQSFAIGQGSNEPGQLPSAVGQLHKTSQALARPSFPSHLILQSLIYCERCDNGR